MTNAPSYRNIELSESPTPAELTAAAEDYRAIVVTMMAAILDRYERADGYPFIDTKLDLITGQDFAVDDPIRGRDAVYGWIQGRGLEALAGHARWLRSTGGHDELVERIRRATREILDRLRQMRARNGGRLSFFMKPDGAPFRLDDAGRPEPFEIDASDGVGTSDLFSAKGMLAAADLLGDDEIRREALAYIADVDTAIRQRTFRSDQISLDPKNRVEPRSGYHTHGATMIQLSAWAMLVRAREPGAVGGGLRHIDYELSTHANLAGRWDHLREGDFWEAVDDEDRPFVEADGVILSDPGHSLEFVGLAMKFLLAAEDAATPQERVRLAAARSRMVTVLGRNFDNGYIAGLKGISKAFDLATRRHLNTDMPWWNLPETIRAAAYCLADARDEGSTATCLRVLRDSHNAFREFVRPDLHLMAYQTRDAAGRPVAVIPATADADPGYHTGLSLIDAIETISGWAGRP